MKDITMRRKDICRIVNELAAGVPEYANSYVDTVRMYMLIWSYCRDHKCTPGKQEYKLVNGVFFINGLAAERVHPLPERIAGTEAGEHWESCILARQYEEV